MLAMIFQDLAVEKRISDSGSGLFTNIFTVQMYIGRIQTKTDAVFYICIN